MGSTLLPRNVKKISCIKFILNYLINYCITKKGRPSKAAPSTSVTVAEKKLLPEISKPKLKIESCQKIHYHPGFCVKLGFVKI